MIRTATTLSIVWLMLASACCAEGIPSKLSVADAISMALRENSGVKEAQQSRLNAESGLRIAGFRTRLDVGSSTSLERTSGERDVSNELFGNLEYSDPTGTEASLDVQPFTSNTGTNSLGLTLRQPLRSGRGMFSEKSDALESARSSYSVSTKELYVARQSTAQNVIESYFRAVLAREQVKVAEKAVGIAEQVTSDAKRRLEEQLVAEIEVSRAEIQLAQTRDELNLRKRTARDALDRLMVAIGVGVGQTPELSDPVPEPDVKTPDPAEAIKTAVSNRAELHVYDVWIADKTRKLAISNDRLRPRLDAVMGYRSYGDSAWFGGSLNANSAFTAGLEYRYSLDRRIETENRDTVARDLELLRVLRGFRVEQITDEVRGALRMLESSRASLDILTANLKVAEKNLSLAQRMVDEGLDDNRNVLSGQENLASIESGIVAARTNLYIAGVDLSYAMGEDITKQETR